MSTPVTIKDATYERQIRSLLQTSEPKVRRAFLAAMADVKNRAQLGLLRDALRSGDVGAAIQALNIDAASFVNIQTTVMEVYAKSGAATVTNTLGSMPMVRALWCVLTACRPDLRNTFERYLHGLHKGCQTKLGPYLGKSSQMGMRSIVALIVLRET
jgi:hypothetical protein